MMGGATPVRDNVALSKTLPSVFDQPKTSNNLFKCQKV